MFLQAKKQAAAGTTDLAGTPACSHTPPAPNPCTPEGLSPEAWAEADPLTQLLWVEQAARKVAPRSDTHFEDGRMVVYVGKSHLETTQTGLTQLESTMAQANLRLEIVAWNRPPDQLGLLLAKHQHDCCCQISPVPQPDGSWVSGKDGASCGGTDKLRSVEDDGHRKTDTRIAMAYLALREMDPEQREEALQDLQLFRDGEHGDPLAYTPSFAELAWQVLTQAGIIPEKGEEEQIAQAFRHLVNADENFGMLEKHDVEGLQGQLDAMFHAAIKTGKGNTSRQRRLAAPFVPQTGEIDGSTVLALIWAQEQLTSGPASGAMSAGSLRSIHELASKDR